MDIFDALAQSAAETHQANTASPAAEKTTSAPTEATEATPNGDINYTPQAVKQSLQELLKFGLLYSDAKPKLYQQASANRTDINRFLAALDLKLVIDDIRGLAFLTVADDLRESNADAMASDSTDSNAKPLGEDEWSHPLVRRQRLNLEQSLLLAILRQIYVNHEQNLGIGNAPAIVNVDEVQLVPFFNGRLHAKSGIEEF